MKSPHRLMAAAGAAALALSLGLSVAGPAQAAGLGAGGVHAVKKKTTKKKTTKKKSAKKKAAKKKIWCTGIQKMGGVNAKQVIEVKVKTKKTANVYRCTRDKKGKYYHYAKAKKAAIGYNGAVAGSKKREGDGKTPKGVYTMRAGFGTAKKKGLSGRKYTRVTKKKQWVWVDGTSKNAKNKKKYNTMQRYSKGYRGEDLRDTVAYKYAQVIGFNEKHTWNHGSAIFLHKMPESGKTAGCVALKQKDLLDTLKWEKKSKVQIAIH